MSAAEAYSQAGYKSKNPRREAYNLRQNRTIAELIELKKAENSQTVDDIIAMAEIEAIEGILEIGRSGENDFAKLKAWQDIVDRRRGKAKQAVDIGGQEGNPMLARLNIHHIKPDESDK